MLKLREHVRGRERWDNEGDERRRCRAARRYMVLVRQLRYEDKLKPEARKRHQEFSECDCSSATRRDASRQ